MMNVNQPLLVSLTSHLIDYASVFKIFLMTYLQYCPENVLIFRFLTVSAVSGASENRRGDKSLSKSLVQKPVHVEDGRPSNYSMRNLLIISVVVIFIFFFFYRNWQKVVYDINVSRSLKLEFLILINQLISRFVIHCLY